MRQPYDKKRKALVDLLLAQSTRSGVTMAIVTTLIGFVVWSSFPSKVVISWMIVGYIINLSRGYIFIAVKKWAASDLVYFRLETTLAILLFLSGLFWGITSWMFLVTDDMAVFVFVALAIVAAAPSALPVFSALPYIWFIYASPLMLLTAAKLYSLGFWELAILAIINLIGLTPLSKNLGSTIEKSVTLDIKNSELLEEVREAKEKAEKANLAKSQFLAATSHDLRQPLHAQGILLEALSLRLKEDEQKDLLDKTMQSNNALNSLFSSLLEISQLDAGTMPVNVSHQSLPEICQLVVDEFHIIAEQKNLTIEFTSDDCVVITDPILLNRILRNLVSNAIKFTEQGGIVLNIKSENEKVIISIADNGIGIPEAQLQNIFDEYYQLDNKARDRSKGIGLGLALVRRMCTLLQHDIRVESKPGEGTCFYLTLPRGESSKIVNKQEEATTSQSIEGLNILLIDDEQPILDAMSVMLQDWSCNTQAFASLKEAEDYLDNNNYKPDIIISDYRLKDDVTGVDAIRSISKRFKEKVPALIISGDTDPELLESVHQQDFYMLQKPLKVAQLKKVIRVLIKKK